jgi:chemotaxis-related protein WspB
MLLLVFHLGQERYALDAAEVAEVLPLVHVKPVAHAPAGVAGVIDVRGEIVPVVDLGSLVRNSPVEPRMSTRLIVVRLATPAGERRLALMAERVSGTITRQDGDFSASGVATTASFLGPLTRDGSELVRRIAVDALLPPSMRDGLDH